MEEKQEGRFDKPGLNDNWRYMKQSPKYSGLRGFKPPKQLEQKGAIDCLYRSGGTFPRQYFQKDG